MHENSRLILEDYDKNNSLYNEFANVIQRLTQSLIKNVVNPHQILFRVKDKESLAGKLERKNHKYTSISQITDIIGLRVILYFEDDIDKVAGIFEQEFTIDSENSIDKRKVDVDKFGYRSLHYVCSLSPQRCVLPEYAKFKDIKFEVQIRSILQHSWAEIEHDLGYKGANQIPETARRTFYRVAALLEQADIEFSKLRKEIYEYTITFKQNMDNKNSNIIIDESSIITFIKSSPTLNEIEASIEQSTTKVMFSSNESWIKIILKLLKKQEIKTIDKLEYLMKKHKEEIIKHNISLYHTIQGEKLNSISSGFSIIGLVRVLENEHIK